MKTYLMILTAVAFSLSLAGAVRAECYADYKAKQNDPLRLHYGVMQLTGPCHKAQAQQEVAGRLQDHEWILLNIVSVFGPEGLQERESSAGNFFLRY